MRSFFCRLRPLLLLSCLSFSGHAAIIAQGSLSDPTGDQRADSGGDLISLTVTVFTTGDVLFQGRFAPGTFLNTSTLAVTIDSDRNPATGRPGIGNPSADTSLISTDYLLVADSAAFQASARLLMWNGSRFSLLPTIYAVTYLADGLDVVVPLADLGNSPYFNFKGSTSAQFSANTFSFIGDDISDIGQPVGTTVPEPSSVAVLLSGITALAWLRHRQ